MFCILNPFFYLQGVQWPLHISGGSVSWKEGPSYQWPGGSVWRAATSWWSADGHGYCFWYKVQARAGGGRGSGLQWSDHCGRDTSGCSAQEHAFIHRVPVWCYPDTIWILAGLPFGQSEYSRSETVSGLQAVVQKEQRHLLSFCATSSSPNPLWLEISCISCTGTVLFSRF